MESIRCQQSQRGFTLIEIIASIGLFVLIISALLPIFPQLLSWSNDTEEELVGGNLLSQVAIEIKTNNSVQAKLQNTVQECNNMIPIPLENSDLGDSDGQYTVNDDDYHTSIEACRENDVNLYRVHIEVLDEQDDVIADSYTYVRRAE